MTLPELPELPELPGWLDPLYSPDEMRAADAFAMDQRGILELELAEKAGAGLAAAVEDVALAGPIRIVVGPGNNGGDGLIAARLLREKGYEVGVIAPLPLEGLQGVPRINLDRLPGEAPQPFDAEKLRGSGAVVDAMLGTGFAGAVDEPLDGVISAINAQDAPVVAADVPSGVNAETGEVEGVAVEAAVTSTNHAPKIGLFAGRGARHAGRVRVTDIGIPRGDPGARLAGLTNRLVLDGIPARSRRDSESGLGTVLVAGGAGLSSGAPCLAALAAMRSGASRVRVAVPASAAPTVGSRLLEALVYGLPEDRDGRHVEDGAQTVARLSAQQGETEPASSDSLPETIVLGPGMGHGPGELAFVRSIGRASPAPLVLCGAALRAYSQADTQEALAELAARPGQTVLVTTSGEAARLLDDDAAGERPLEAARGLADLSQSVVLLDEDSPIVAAPESPCAVVAVGAAGHVDTGALDTTGADNVLAGLVGALLSRGLDPFEASAAGAFARAEASKLASDRIGGADHTIASDIIEALPGVLSGALSGAA